MAKSKKPNRTNEGFRIANLLSPTEVSYARATSRGIKADIDKADFVKAKADYRETEIRDLSFLNNYIDNVEALVFEKEKREEVKEEVASEPVEAGVSE